MPADAISVSLLLDDSGLFDSDDNVVDSGSRIDISSLLLVLFVELHAARNAAVITAAVTVSFRTKLYFMRSALLQVLAEELFQFCSYVFHVFRHPVSANVRCALDKVKFLFLRIDSLFESVVGHVLRIGFAPREH